MTFDIPSQSRVVGFYGSDAQAMVHAEELAELIHRITPEVSVTISPHEPFSGAHVGPGMLGLFFKGVER